jgi:hypothetical protein
VKVYKNKDTNKQAKSKLNVFNNNHFFRTLGQYAAEIIKKTEQEQRDYTEKEKYVVFVLLAAKEVTTCYDQMCQALLYLSNFRTTKSLKNAGINRFKHIVFNIENYFIRISSLLDKTLVLINEVYMLGNSNENCKEHIIFKNKHLKNTKVLDLTKKLKKKTNDYREKRNKIIHTERYRDKELNQIEGMYLLIEISEPHRMIFDPNFQIETNYRENRTRLDLEKEKKKRFKEMGEICFNFLKDNRDLLMDNNYLNKTEKELIDYNHRLYEIIDQLCKVGKYINPLESEKEDYNDKAILEERNKKLRDTLSNICQETNFLTRVKIRTDDYLKTIKPELEKNKEEVFEIIWKIFEEFNIIFNNAYNSMR